MATIINNIKQGTDEWFNIRAGKFTGSDFHTFFGSGETKKKLLCKKAIERLNNCCLMDFYTNPDIERGKEEEANARLLYEMESGQEVEQIAFAVLNDWVGCSPDGLVNDKGLIEIKCPKDVIFASQVINNSIKPEHYTQIQFNMYVLNREWCDYIMYNQNFKLYTKRYFRDEDYTKKIIETIELCKKEVENYINIMANYKL